MMQHFQMAQQKQEWKQFAYSTSYAISDAISRAISNRHQWLRN